MELEILTKMSLKTFVFQFFLLSSRNKLCSFMRCKMEICQHCTFFLVSYLNELKTSETSNSLPHILFSLGMEKLRVAANSYIFDLL